MAITSGLVCNFWFTFQGVICSHVQEHRHSCMCMKVLSVVTPQIQTKGFFTILEEIALQLALPSDAGESQIALLICLQGDESAGGHFKRWAHFQVFCMIKACTWCDTLAPSSTPNPALWLLCLPENSVLTDCTLAQAATAWRLYKQRKCTRHLMQFNTFYLKPGSASANANWLAVK